MKSIIKKTAQAVFFIYTLFVVSRNKTWYAIVIEITTDYVEEIK